MSDARPSSSRIDLAASISGLSDRALKKAMASKRFDFPTPLAPVIQVNGPNLTSTSTRFLKPLTFSRVSMQCLLYGAGMLRIQVAFNTNPMTVERKNRVVEMKKAVKALLFLELQLV